MQMSQNLRLKQQKIHIYIYTFPVFFYQNLFPPAQHLTQLLKSECRWLNDRKYFSDVYIFQEKHLHAQNLTVSLVYFGLVR